MKKICKPDSASQNKKIACSSSPNRSDLMLPDFQGLLLVGAALSVQPEGSFLCAQQEVVPQLKTTPRRCAWAPGAWVGSAEYGHEAPANKWFTG